MNRVIVSDVHLGSEAAVAGPHPYGWLTPQMGDSLAEFLRSPTVLEADQLIIAGDLLDLWVCPVDVRPPSAFDVIDAGQNVEVVRAIREVASARTRRRQVIYIPGNHDMDVTPAAASAVHPAIVFGKHFDDAGLRVRHGHEGCLFNGPDPQGRRFPIGYWLTRMAATGVARGAALVNLDLWTILKNSAEVDRVADGKSLALAVWDVVAAASGVSQDEWCVLPNGSRCQLQFARSQYEHLAEEWAAARGSYATAVQCEWDPWYDLPVGPPRLHVSGHSHRNEVASGPYGAYLNTGCWCGPEQTYAQVTTAMGINHDVISGALFRWDGSRSEQQISTTVGVPI